jgi:hypothetical protein
MIPRCSPIRLLRLTGALLLVLHLSSCATYRENREWRTFNRIQSGIRYSTYKNASTVSLPLIFTASKWAINPKDAEILSTLSIDDVRIMAGMVSHIAGKNRYSLAESNIVLERSKDTGALFLAHAMRTMVMYEQQLKRIGVKEEQKAGNLKSLPRPEWNTPVQQIMSLLILGKMYFHKGDFVSAVSVFTDISQLTQMVWPLRFCEILFEADRGNINEARKKALIFLADDATPAEVKKATTSLITYIIARPKNIKKAKNMTDAFYHVLIEQLSSDGTYSSLIQLGKYIFRKVE